MKGLLLKDFYMAKNYCRFIFLIIIFFAGMAMMEGNMAFIYYPIIFASMIPISLLGYDEREGWIQYVQTLPCKRKTFVTEKYIVAFISLFYAMMVLLLFVVGKSMIQGEAIQTENILQLLGIVLLMGCLIPMIAFPCAFKFGVEKGRIVNLICVGFLCGASAVFTSEGVSSKVLDFFEKTKNFGCVLGILLILVLLYISWVLSVSFFENREITK